MEETNISKEEIKDAFTEALKEEKDREVLKTTNTTTVDLPSAGLMNKNIKSVTLRRMSVKEMKTLHTSSDPNYLTTLLIGCIVEPSNITAYDLHPNDVIYLLFILRHISSPRNVVQKSICDVCRKEFDVEIKIDELLVNYSTTDNNEFTIKLEENGDVITFRILSEGEIVDKERLALRKARQENMSEEDTQWYTLLARTVYWIEAINDKHIEDFKEKLEYLSNLSAFDFETLRQAYATEVNKFGLNRKFITTCPHCSNDVEVEAYIAPDFFRLV